jgi:GTP-binding protein HflX
LLSDTVGFIHWPLPESFKAHWTRCGKPIILHVVDISHPTYEDQMGVVNKLLQELNVHDKPVLTVFNKMDATNPDL